MTRFSGEYTRRIVALSIRAYPVLRRCLAVCRRERVFSEESALGGRFEVKIWATDAILPSHSTINEVGKLLSDRLLGQSHLNSL